jgi:hypothetical protein
MTWFARHLAVFLLLGLLPASLSRGDRDRHPDREELKQSCLGWHDGWTLFEYSLTKNKWNSTKSPVGGLIRSHETCGPQIAARLVSSKRFTGEYFDRENRTWHLIGQSPLGNQLGGMRGTAVTVGTKVVVFADTTSPPRGAVYDTQTRNWRVIAEAPIVPRLRCARVVIGHNVLYWGGYGGGFDPTQRDASGPLTDGASYNLQSDEWVMLPESPVKFDKRMYGMGWAVWDGKLVVVGGRENRLGMIYDPKAQSWQLTTEAPFPVACNSACAVVGDSLFLWSGGDPLDGRGVLYDFRAKIWKETARAPITGRYLPFAQSCGSKVIVWGGWITSKAVANGVSFVSSGASYDVLLDTWDRIPDMPGEVPYELHPGW